MLTLPLPSTKVGMPTLLLERNSLGYSTLNQTQVNEVYEHLFHMYGHSQGDQRLDVGNAVAQRSGFTPLEKFLNDCDCVV
ncbi:hypothetical protein ABVT39_027420 [Epinephelus coioides]